MAQVTLSENAARRIAAIQANRGEQAMLRVIVTGGGCSGFQYEFTFVAAAGEDDLIVERDGMKLVVDSMSLAYMAGSEVDYVEELVGSSFKVRNPQAATSCSCGVSFAV